MERMLSPQQITVGQTCEIFRMRRNLIVKSVKGFMALVKDPCPLGRLSQDSQLLNGLFV